MPPFLLPFLAGAKSFLGAALAFFSKPPGVYIGIALAVIVSLWWYGQHEFNRGAASVVQKQQFQAARLVVHQANITYTISMKYEALKLSDEKQTAKLIQEIPAHVTPQSDAACSIGLGLVRVWNAADHGPIPDATAGPDDTPSGLALSDLARVETENAGEYDKLAHQLTALQEWVTKQQKAAAQR